MVDKIDPTKALNLKNVMPQKAITKSDSHLVFLFFGYFSFFVPTQRKKSDTTKQIRDFN
jgi:hypothetical protein